MELNDQNNEFTEITIQEIEPQNIKIEPCELVEPEKDPLDTNPKFPPGCDTCGKIFGSLHSISNLKHIRNCKIAFNYYDQNCCTLCKKVVPKTKVLAHFSFAHVKETWLSKNESLKPKIKIENDPEDMICQWCNWQFFSPESLQNHISKCGPRKNSLVHYKYEKEKYKFHKSCDNCGKTFKTFPSKTYNTHIASCQKAFKYYENETCTLCTEQIAKENFHDHFTQFHETPKPKIEKAKKKTGKEVVVGANLPRSCDSCGKVFKNIYSLNLPHIEKCRATFKYFDGKSCTVCGKELSLRGFQYHFSNLHKDKALIGNTEAQKSENVEQFDENQFKINRKCCERCGKKFPRKVHMQNVQTHNQKCLMVFEYFKENKCTLCDENVSRKEFYLHCEKMHKDIRLKRIDTENSSPDIKTETFEKAVEEFKIENIMDGE